MPTNKEETRPPAVAARRQADTVAGARKSPGPGRWQSAVKVHLTDEVLCRQVHDEAVLLDLETQRYFGLDAVGARVWSLLEADPHLDRALQVLIREFEVGEETLKRDVELFLDMLVANGLANLEARVSETGTPGVERGNAARRP